MMKYISRKNENGVKVMAYILSPYNIPAYWPKTETVPSCPMLIERQKAYLEANLLALGTRGFDATLYGKHLPAELFPTGATAERNNTEGIDAIGLCNFYAISQRWKDLIGSLEPDVHQFEPAAVAFKDGSTSDFYSFVAGNSLENIFDFSKITAEAKPKINGGRRISVRMGGDKGKIFVFRKFVEGHHIWVAHDASRKLMVSDEHKARMDALGIQDVQSLYVEEVD
jgi:hypothetical protein